MLRNSQPNVVHHEQENKTASADLYVGTSGYAYKEWKGPFYPEDTKQAGMLHFYGTQFQCVEINNTFYRTPKQEVLQKWVADVPRDFLFAFKAPQRITHFQRLRNAADSVSYLFRNFEVLDDHLGPVLFQMPPNFSKDASRLEDFLCVLPPQRRVAFEFRHESWFDDDIFQLLISHQAALCMAESEEGVHVPLVPTAPWGYLRLRRSDYDEAALAGWVNQISEQKWSEVFVFFKHEDEGKAPQTATKFSRAWSAAFGKKASSAP